MPLTLRPVLHACAAATLAATLTATAVLPATASSSPPEPSPDSVAASAAQTASTAQAAATNSAPQTAAPVVGEGEQTLTVDGVSAEALPEDAPAEAIEAASSTGQVVEQQATEPSSEPSAVAADQQAAGEQTAEERELAETALPTADVEDLAALSEPTDTKDFVVAGLTWEVDGTDSVAEASIRVREAGEWTDWASLEIHDANQVPGVTRTGTEPLVSTGADGVQVRVLTASGATPEGLEVSLIDPGTSVTDGRLAPASPAGTPATTPATTTPAAGTVDAAPASGPGPDAGRETVFEPALAVQHGPLTGTATAQTVATRNDAVTQTLKPAIITRAQWGANEAWAQNSSRSSTLQAMYIHHTAGTNNYTKATAYGQVRGIYSYHAQTLGWGDIGYQFLVDKFGTIYEGRRGSLDALPIGAQAGGFNTNTIGISAMGDYDVTAAPAVMVSAIEKVLAWQAYRYNLNPTGTTTLTSGGGGSARYAAGRTVNVPTILGHTVTNTTACPGRYLNAQLPAMRTKVSAAVAAAVKRHTAPPAPAVPGAVKPVKHQWADGMLSISWTRPAGVQRYEVMRRVAPAGTTKYGAWQTVAWVDAAKATSGRFDVSPGTTAHFAVRSHNAAGSSGLFTVATYTRPAAPQAPGAVKPVKHQWVSGKLSIWWTRPAGVQRYEVMRRVAPAGTTKYGAWQTVAWVDAAKATSGRFDVSPGTTAHFAVRSHNAAGSSGLFTVATYTRPATR